MEEQRGKAGKYDGHVERILREHGAETVLLLVIGGNQGDGFSVASIDEDAPDQVVTLLRMMADEIERGAQPSGVKRMPKASS